MVIGVPEEVKDQERRVAVLPFAVRALTAAGHRVLVQAGAGAGAGYPDAAYAAAGAEIVAPAASVWSEADLVVKVKEPLPSEYGLMREGQALFTYLHLVTAPRLVAELLRRRITAIAYETVQLDDGSLPLLAPMSEIAGRLAVQVGARYLEAGQGGPGVLLGGVPGVEPGCVAIVGCGTAGFNALKMAYGLKAEVYALDVNATRLRHIDDLFPGAHTVISNVESVARIVPRADLVVGAVLVPGARAPRVLEADHIRSMRPGSVFVDIAIDQGGCSETSRPTTASEPVFTREGVVHYCVTNMPAQVARTSSRALAHNVFPFLLELANRGIVGALAKQPALLRGLNTFAGRVTHPVVARDLGCEFTPAAELLA